MTYSNQNYYRDALILAVFDMRIFYHRNAFIGAMYESQTQTKKIQFFEKRFGAIFDKEEIYLELNKKYAKTTYRGKPTKKYAKLCERLQQMKEVDYMELEAALNS